ncbi:MAG: nucleotidyltransferase domain-containing protein [Chloroflexi bacterium]|nr:nucleotidyltransferase domain-containing protein [Chloroflexota bacterium]
MAKVLKELLGARGIRADRIVVFGSFARGRQRRDSDIDVLVVSRDFRNKSIFDRAELTTGIGRDMVRRLGRPFDLMYYSDLEWNRGHSLVVNAAKSEGQVIYG